MCSLSVQVLHWTTLNILLLNRAFLPVVYTHFVHRFIIEALCRTANLSRVSRYTGKSLATRQLALALGVLKPRVQTQALMEKRRVGVSQARQSAACCLNIPCWSGWQVEALGSDSRLLLILVNWFKYLLFCCPGSKCFCLNCAFNWNIFFKILYVIDTCVSVFLSCLTFWVT